jgi:nucleotide-binding universal stress UspA family protein
LRWPSCGGRIARGLRDGALSLHGHRRDQQRRVQQYLADSQRQATEALARISALAQVPGVTLSTETVEGSSPAEQIVETARRCGADLIVMGSNGRTGVARVLLGSVAGKVLMLSPVPVMIIK